MPTARYLSAAAIVGDFMHVAGGFDTSGGPKNFLAEIYSVLADTWTTGLPDRG
jgi:hypothetical protein